MRRINVIGTSGSGKSRFCRQLVSKLDSPHCELDALYWQANWTSLEKSAFLQKIVDVTAQPCWILDGNFNWTVDTKWVNVETVIWIDYSLARTMFHAVKRALHRAITRK